MKTFIEHLSKVKQINETYLTDYTGKHDLDAILEANKDAEAGD